MWKDKHGHFRDLSLFMSFKNLNSGIKLYFSVNKENTSKKISFTDIL